LRPEQSKLGYPNPLEKLARSRARGGHMAIQRKVRDGAQSTGLVRAATKRISTVELLRNFGRQGDAALAEPIILTKSGRDRLVLISIEQYEVLRKTYDAIQLTRPASSSGRNNRTA